MGFNERQQRAIDSRGDEILVSAAAGSGKTAVLTARVLNLIINDNIPIDRLLIITFTRLATAEMRERISKALYDEIKTVKDKQKKEVITKQISLLNKAYISTMDSFFADIVRKNFKIVDIDPTFRMGEEYEFIKIKKDILNELFEKYFSSEEYKERFADLVDIFSLKTGEDGLSKVIFEIQDIANQVDDFDKWLDNQLDIYKIDNEDDLINSMEFKKTFSKFVFSKINFLKYYILKEIEIILQDTAFDFDNLEDYNALPDFAKSDLMLVDDIISIFDREYREKTDDFNIITKRIKEYSFSSEKFVLKNNYSEFREFINSYKFKSISKKVFENVRVIVEVETIRKTIREKVFREEFRNNFIPLAEMARQNSIICNEIALLCHITKEFNDMYMQYKREHSVFSFGDILHFCYEIICKNSDIAQEYSESFDEIIIDEYQDSNILQEKIFATIFKNGVNRRFSVGDVKQCIYTFRNSDPKIFVDKYNNSEKIEIINLNQNYRSRKCVIDFVNYIFEKIMNEKIGGVLYDENAKLKEGFDYESKDGDLKNKVSHKCEAYICCDEKGKYENNAEQEAKIVVERINNLIKDNFHIYDKEEDKVRPIKYKDIAILYRTGTESYVKPFFDILDKNSIPYCAVNNKTKGFYKTSEISLIISLLKVIDNPLCQIEFAAVLNSPIGTLTSDELFEIRTTDVENNLFFAAKRYVDNTSENTLLKHKLTTLFEKLEKWRFLSSKISVTELISYLYNETGYYEMSEILPNDAIRKANLDLFLEQANTFSEYGTGALFDFLQYIKNIENNDEYSVESASISGGNDNVVQVMTIHKSKGLEFPVVFVVNANNAFNLEDITSKKKVIADKDIGLGFFTYNYTKEINKLSQNDKIEYSDIIPRFKNEHFYRMFIKESIKERLISEGMRVLYVAATRAREKLIFVSVFRKKNGNSFLNWLFPVFIRCRNEEKSFFDYNFYNTEDEKEIIESEEVDENTKSAFSEIIKNIIDFSDYMEISEKKEEIEKILDWKYKYLQDTITPSVTTVSEIKKNQFMLLSDEIEEKETGSFTIDDFTLPQYYVKSVSEGTKGAERGTAYHTVMEHIDFDIKTIEEIENFINHLCKKNILTKEQAKAIEPNKILSFIKSELCEDGIKNAVCVKREQAFTMQIAPKDVYINNPDFENCSKNMLVHGIIDLYFETPEGNIILVDYKTDNFKNESEMKKRYGIQIEIYKKALEKATGKKVVEMYLYLFKTNKALKL